MQRRIIMLSMSMGLLAGCQMNAADLAPIAEIGSQVAMQKGLGQSDQLTKGLRELLNISATRSVQKLSTADAWTMLLPAQAQSMVDTLRKAGLGSYVDKAQARLNDAAARTAAESLPIFKSAIGQLNTANAIQIMKGGSTAATQYFRTQTEAQLRAKLAPVVTKQLQQSNFYDQYKTLLNAYNALPLANKQNIDIEQHVVDKTLDKLYTQMAAEETLIRKNPSQYGNAVLQYGLEKILTPKQ